VSDEKETEAKVIERMNTESRQRGFVEYPKWLYHPDGRSALITNRTQQTELGGEWLESPTEAIAEKEKRDKRDSDKFIANVNAEAAATAAAKAKK
jgi:hypothetical protein